MGFGARCVRTRPTGKGRAPVSWVCKVDEAAVLLEDAKCTPDQELLTGVMAAALRVRWCRTTSIAGGWLSCKLADINALSVWAPAKNAVYDLGRPENEDKPWQKMSWCREDEAGGIEVQGDALQPVDDHNSHFAAACDAHPDAANAVAGQLVVVRRKVHGLQLAKVAKEMVVPPEGHPVKTCDGEETPLGSGAVLEVQFFKERVADTPAEADAAVAAARTFEMSDPPTDSMISAAAIDASGPELGMASGCRSAGAPVNCIKVRKDLFRDTGANPAPTATPNATDGTTTPIPIPDASTDDTTDNSVTDDVTGDDVTNGIPVKFDQVLNRDGAGDEDEASMIDATRLKRLDGTNVFVVDRLLGHSHGTARHKRRWLVKWRNFGAADECTWELEHHGSTGQSLVTDLGADIFCSLVAEFCDSTSPAEPLQHWQVDMDRCDKCRASASAGGGFCKVAYSAGVADGDDDHAAILAPVREALNLENGDEAVGGISIHDALEVMGGHRVQNVGKGWCCLLAAAHAAGKTGTADEVQGLVQTLLETVNADPMYAVEDRRDADAPFHKLHRKLMTFKRQLSARSWPDVVPRDTPLTQEHCSNVPSVPSNHWLDWDTDGVLLLGKALGAEHNRVVVLTANDGSTVTNIRTTTLHRRGNTGAHATRNRLRPAVVQDKCESAACLQAIDASHKDLVLLYSNGNHYEGITIDPDPENTPATHQPL